MFKHSLHPLKSCLLPQLHFLDNSSFRPPSHTCSFSLFTFFSVTLDRKASNRVKMLLKKRVTLWPSSSISHQIICDSCPSARTSPSTACVSLLERRQCCRQDRRKRQHLMCLEQVNLLAAKADCHWSSICGEGMSGSYRWYGNYIFEKAWKSSARRHDSASERGT